jgi:hypothetical protein
MPGTSPRELHVEPSELTAQRLESIVREQTGKTVSLQPGAYRAMELRKLEEFTPEAVTGLEANANAAKVRFRASAE